MPDETWSITDHACRGCFGRVLQADGSNIYRCAGCGAEAADSPVGICGCGILPGPIALRAGRTGSTFHCGPNPRRGPDSPAEVSILFGDPTAAAEEAEAAP